MNGQTLSNPAVERVQQLISARQFDRAEALLSEFINGGNASAQLYYQLGVTKAMSGRQHHALQDFRRAISMDPAFSEGYNGLALALFELGELVAANDVCEQAFTLSKPCIKLYSSWAKILQRMNRLDKAKDLLEKALLIQPNNLTLWCNLAAIAGELNDKQTAIACFQRALQIYPGLVDVHGSIAEHRDYTSVEDEHIKQMHLALQKAVHPKVIAGVAFGLARAYEKLADYATATSYYRLANGELYKLAPYDHAQTEQQFSAIKNYFSQEKLQQLSQFGSTDDTPIFIVGMPRSGTSLVEQILASHSQVFGAGELNHIKALLLRDGDYLADDFVSAQFDVGEEKLKTLATDYLRLLRQYDRKAHHIVDKMPHNFRLLGLIRCLFPNAKIIHCQRNKQDVVLSNYKANFATNLRYATDLTAAMQFYGAYEDLMAHWQNVMPNKILSVKYEDLIKDQQATTAQLLKFCNLPWQDDCLNFYQTQRTVATASASQVKQPLYNSAVDYWKKFAVYMPELQL
ncbi:tetratricopeptide repeat-containing sulfotransferase family protein [Halioxenophilus aromaticivorans]|uniref:Tetratricopeptide repeat-containing sulfotransferase family protein n=1 Tax=Halioxenophilus aromaticivorans TaxID=1306992 RepID=A0AAV3TZA1_9ALTE